MSLPVSASIKVTIDTATGRLTPSGVMTSASRTTSIVDLIWIPFPSSISGERAERDQREVVEWIGGVAKSGERSVDGVDDLPLAAQDLYNRRSR